MLDSQEVYSRERKLRATFKNHLNSAHLQKVSNTLLQDLVKLPTLQPAYTVNGSKGFQFHGSFHGSLTHFGLEPGGQISFQARV